MWRAILKSCFATLQKTIKPSIESRARYAQLFQRTLDRQMRSFDQPDDLKFF
jgi:hypothetical protein